MPPLRWSDATGFSQLRDLPGLPDAWWRATPVTRVFAVLGPDALGELLTELALEHWPAASVGDVLPALHVMDPDEADEPQVSIALDRAGSWHGLLALTGRELSDQPFIRVRPVLTALFTAVFVRLAPAGAAAQPADAAARQARRASAEAGQASRQAAQPEQAAHGMVPEPARAPDEASRQAARAHAASPAQGSPEADRLPVRPLPPLPKRQPASADYADPLGLAAARMAEAALENVSRGFAGREGDAGPSRTSMFTPPPRPERPPAAPGFGLDPRPFVPGPAPEPFDPGPVAFGSPPAPFAAGSDPFGPGPGGFGAVSGPSGESSPYGPERADTGPQAREAGDRSHDAAHDHDGDPEDTGPAEHAEAPEAHASEAHASEAHDPGASPEPSDARALDEAEADSGAHPQDEASQPLENPEVPDVLDAGQPEDAEHAEHEAAEHHEEAPAAERGAGTTTGDLGTGAPRGGDAEPDIPGLIDAAFSGLDDKTWAVAQNHVFTDSPAAPEELAKLFAVPAEEILTLEDDLRLRLADWLDSDEAAPYARHLEKLSGTLGVAAPKARLVGAAPWHTRELRSLDVPAWQFVLATLPGYTVQEEWVVSGDLAELRERTCALILDADRPPTVARALELVSGLGVHPEVAKEWLENVPQLRIQSTKKGGKPAAKDTGRAGEPKQAASAPPGQLKDVSMTRRCFRHPDGLWWLRVDIAPEQITGGECPLPSGFAAYLGMSPGESRSVMSAAGEITLSWQARPVIDSLGQLLHDMGAAPGAHLFLTVAEDDKVLRARLVPASAVDADKGARALRLAGHTAGGDVETLEETIRVLATRIGMTGPVGLPELMNRLRERGDRDLLSLMV
ncbi:hypothetical protein [Sphaerisporangium sp. TRM90804]|uniref:hypothetical protein n=1 Tax=Sphaerisporangium sp. TRM90804 TaxID=3031113 RepID=UPI00244A5F18|nr:hypothetical protein [Sphaerisporangium sp. TRM90804]MDH2429891.1 hypothetical protein [Sphaerisporangium sp. TRM90804]